MRNWARQLLTAWRNDKGVAAVEFALILPILLFVYVGTVEASALISMDRRVQSVTGAVGDLVAQSNQQVSAASLRDYFRAARVLMTPYSADPLTQVVTGVQIDEDGDAEVVWSRQFENNVYSVSTQYSPGDSYTLPEEMVDIATDGFVIVSETSYSYLPLYGIVFNQPVNLYRQNFYLPRFGGTIAITN